MVTFDSHVELPKRKIWCPCKSCMIYSNHHFPSYLKDKAQPETQVTSFGNILFNAKLAVDDPEAILLVNQPGSDGFKVDSAPLFQVSQNKLVCQNVIPHTPCLQTYIVHENIESSRAHKAQRTRLDT